MWKKRRRRVEKSGVPVDAVFTEINDLGQKSAEIHGFLDMPVPTCGKARPASVGRSIAGFPVAVDERRGRIEGGQRRRSSIEAHVDELRSPARRARSSIELGGPPFPTRPHGRRGRGRAAGRRPALPTANQVNIVLISSCNEHIIGI
ncbi:TPA: hypothetical protein QDB09_005411 [Burkholderia vietnamiensis]|nr:hypothetical protein [Burkholderia vietnamiensis]